MADFTFGNRRIMKERPEPKRKATCPCCPECGRKVQVREDGTTMRHRDTCGRPCYEGSGVTPVMKHAAPAPGGM